MLKRIATITTTVAVAAIFLAGCSTAANPANSSATPTDSPSATTSADAAALTTASSPLGEIITDEAGYTVYHVPRDTHRTRASATATTIAQ